MSLWIVLCGLLVVTLPHNMGAPCVVYWGRSAFPYARRDQGDPAFNRPQINPPRVGPGRCLGPGLFYNPLRAGPALDPSVCAVKVLDIAVLLDFFENGNPPPVGSRPYAFSFRIKKEPLFHFQ